MESLLNFFKCHVFSLVGHWLLIFAMTLTFDTEVKLLIGKHFPYFVKSVRVIVLDLTCLGLKLTI